MNKKECFYLGKIAKKFSFKGEVLVYLDTDEPQMYEDMESVFVAFGENLIPYFIESAKIHKNRFLRIHFEDVNSEEEADQLIGCELYLPLSVLPQLEGNQFYYHEIIGFDVVDQRLGNIGVISGVNDTNPQSLFEIDYQDAQILVPMIDEFIVKIDRENKTIILKTPEGLVDLYLNN